MGNDGVRCFGVVKMLKVIVSILLYLLKYFNYIRIKVLSKKDLNFRRKYIELLFWNRNKVFCNGFKFLKLWKYFLNLIEYKYFKYFCS